VLQPHIIIITYGFPPYTKSLGGAIRMLKLSEYFTANGFDVSVVCVSTRLNEAYGYEETLSKIAVKTCADPFAYFARSSASLPRGNNSQKSSVWSQIRARSVQRLKQIILDFMVPDSGCLTIHSMISMVAKEVSNIDGPIVLITSGPPHSMHLVGHAIKKNFPQVRWIMDYRDSWNGTSLFRKKNRLLQFFNSSLEVKCLLGADHITYISGPMLKKAEAVASGSLQHKSTFISNGYDERLQPRPCPPRDANEMPLRVGYFGMIDDTKGGYREPTCLFEALNLLSNGSIQFVVHGPSVLGPEWGSRSGQSIVNGGKLSHSEALKQMNEMDALLLLHTCEAGADEVLTGKVFEYIATGLPIISVGPREMAVNALLKDDEAFHWASHLDVNGIAEIFQKLLLAKEAGELHHRHPEKILIHSRTRQHEKFLRLVTGSGA
jgi:glycosyltransferase involved in cell wall biosynthesis